MIYTVGNEVSYDKGLRKHGRKFMKIGRHGDYPGGFALKTAEDALQLIRERQMDGEWAVYSLDADWEQDTVPSENGWWHALVNNAVVLGKIRT